MLSYGIRCLLAETIEATEKTIEKDNFPILNIAYHYLFASSLNNKDKFVRILPFVFFSLPLNKVIVMI